MTTFPIYTGHIPSTVSHGTGPLTVHPASLVIAGQDGLHNAFPTLLDLGDGEVLVGYRRGTEHLQEGYGVGMTLRGSDYGNTWAEPAEAFAYEAEGRTWDVRSMSLSKLPDETVVASFFMWDKPGADWIAHGPYYITSADNGHTFGQVPTLIPSSFTGTIIATADKIVPDDQGRLHLAIYGLNAGDTHFSAHLLTSESGLLAGPWTETVMVDGQAQGRNHDEPMFGQLAAGGFRVYARRDTNGIAVKNTTDPLAWPAGGMSTVLGISPTANGRPSWLQTISGGVHIFFRDGSVAPQQGATATSWGGAFSARAAVPPVPAQRFSYGDMAEVAPGMVATVYSIEHNDNEADLYFRYFIDQEITEPVVPATLAYTVDGTRFVGHLA